MRSLIAWVTGVCMLASCAGGDEAIDREGSAAETASATASTEPVSAAALEQARRELTPVLRRDTHGLASITTRDGAQMIATEGRFGAAMIVRRNGDGSTTKTCVDDVEEAVRVLAAPTVAKPGLVTK
jgi:hypothetical protein